MGHTYAKDRAEWLELCRPCHRQEDGPTEEEILAAGRVIAKAMRHVHHATADLDEAIAERDRMIRAAIEEKTSYARIAEMTGLSEQRLYQVRRSARI